MSLTPKIRRTIFKFVVSDMPKTIELTLTPPIRGSYHHVTKGNKPALQDSALLYVNKQISHEFQLVLYSRQFVFSGPFSFVQFMSSAPGRFDLVQRVSIQFVNRLDMGSEYADQMVTLLSRCKELKRYQFIGWYQADDPEGGLDRLYEILKPLFLAFTQSRGGYFAGIMIMGSMLSHSSMALEHSTFEHANGAEVDCQQYMVGRLAADMGLFV